MYKSVTKLAGLGAFVILAGCSESGFADMFQAGKYSPDESQVKTNQALTTPRDLRLRPPQQGGAEPGQVATVQPGVTAQPPQYGTAPQNPQGSAVPPVGQAPATTPPPRGDVYSRNGISRFRPDGSKKSEFELLQELRALKLKRQQAKNKNYGTIFNLPKVLSKD